MGLNWQLRLYRYISSYTLRYSITHLEPKKCLGALTSRVIQHNSKASLFKHLLLHCSHHLP